MNAPTEIITAGRDGARRWSRNSLSGPLYAVKTYRLATRADGAETYRLVASEGSYSVLSTCERAAEGAADSAGLWYVPNVVHGTPAEKVRATLAPIEALAND